MVTAAQMLHQLLTFDSTEESSWPIPNDVIEEGWMSRSGESNNEKQHPTTITTSLTEVRGQRTEVSLFTFFEKSPYNIVPLLTNR